MENKVKIKTIAAIFITLAALHANAVQVNSNIDKQAVKKDVKKHGKKAFPGENWRKPCLKNNHQNYPGCDMKPKQYKGPAIKPKK
jgi:hypothetical protein